MKHPGMDEVGGRLTRDQDPPAPSRLRQPWTGRYLIALCLAMLLAVLNGSSCSRDVQADAAVQELIREVQASGGRAEPSPGGNCACSVADVERVLDVTFNGTNVTDQDIVRLSRMKGFPYVAYLSLADTRVADEGIAALVNHPKLSRIGLSRTRITDRAMTSLGKIPRLYEADLTGTSISDEGLALLRKHGDPLQLRLLILTDTKVTEVKARELADAWKMINIVYGSGLDSKQSSSAR